MKSINNISTFRILLLILTIMFLLAIALQFKICKYPKRDIPLFNDFSISFGDSPRNIQNKMKERFVSYDELSNTYMTVYTYESELLDNPAIYYFYFQRNRFLTSISVVIEFEAHSQAVDFFENAKKTILTYYDDDETLNCNKMVMWNEDHFSQTLCQNIPTGINYVLTVKYNEFCLFLEDNRIYD